MNSITAVASAVRDHNALCSVYIDTTKATDALDCLSEIAHQFTHRRVVGEPDVTTVLLNPNHPLSAVLADAILKAASTLVDVSNLEYLQCRPWVNFFNSAGGSYSVALMGRHAKLAKVGTPTFKANLTEASPDSGIKARLSREAKDKGLYRDLELIVTGEDDLRSQLKTLDLSTLNTLGNGLLMNINGCQTLVTGDNLTEFGHATDLTTQQWQQAVIDRLTEALNDVQIDPDIAGWVKPEGQSWLSLSVWFESTLKG